MLCHYSGPDPVSSEKHQVTLDTKLPITHPVMLSERTGGIAGEYYGERPPLSSAHPAPGTDEHCGASLLGRVLHDSSCCQVWTSHHHV